MKNFLYTVILSLGIVGFTNAQVEECLDCHSDESLTMERNGREVSVFVNEDHFMNSIHRDLECVDCHEDFDPEEFPHREGEEIHKVECSNCHDTEEFEEGIHGQKGLNCFDCHTKHSIAEAGNLSDQGPDFCLTCHKSAAVKGYIESVHYKKYKEGETSPMCIDCHGTSTHDIAKADFSEDELHELCATCHEQPVENFENSLHGKALANGKFLAPNCIKCHSSHKILSHTDENSKTYKMNIPALCGDCHKDGTRVSELRTISQRHILENYAESIHGDGLFRRGLIVSAVCTDCHFSHNILPHENPESSINRDNIAKTCTQCHAQIERVHVKVINGELWGKRAS